MDKLPSSHYHSATTAAFNAAERKRRAEGALPPSLTESGLLAAAFQSAGIAEPTQFDDTTFLPLMRSWLDALRNEAALNPHGEMMAFMLGSGMLTQRVLAEDWLRNNPSIEKRAITAPLVIVGPHRSGTTRLHRLMAADQRWSTLKTWEGMAPAPIPGLPGGGKEHMAALVEQQMAYTDEAYPGAFAAHPMRAHWPEEEMLLLNQHFAGFTLFGAYAVPSFYRAFLEHDRRPAYDWLARILKLVSWARPEGSGQRWLLKCPQHMLDLDVLWAVFPDARVVFTHRDPVKTVGSILSLCWLYVSQHTDQPCRQPVRDIWLDYCERTARACIEARPRHPSAQQLDIFYDDVARDWRQAVKAIYDFAGMELTPAAVEAMQAWSDADDSHSRWGPHRYDLSDFGLTVEEVRDRMRFVQMHYGIASEG